MKVPETKEVLEALDRIEEYMKSNKGRSIEELLDPKTADIVKEMIKKFERKKDEDAMD